MKNINGFTIEGFNILGLMSSYNNQYKSITGKNYQGKISLLIYPQYNSNNIHSLMNNNIPYINGWLPFNNNKPSGYDFTIIPQSPQNQILRGVLVNNKLNYGFEVFEIELKLNKRGLMEVSYIQSEMEYIINN